MTIEEAEKTIKAFTEKYGFELGYKIEFPIYNILPDEVFLALKILGKHGMVVKIILNKK